MLGTSALRVMKVWLWSALFLLSDGRRLQDEHYELNPTATSRMMKRFGQYLPKIEKSLQQQFLFRRNQPITGFLASKVHRRSMKVLSVIGLLGFSTPSHYVHFLEFPVGNG